MAPASFAHKRFKRFNSALKGRSSTAETAHYFFAGLVEALMYTPHAGVNILRILVKGLDVRDHFTDVLRHPLSPLCALVEAVRHV